MDSMEFFFNRILEMAATPRTKVTMTFENAQEMNGQSIVAASMKVEQEVGDGSGDTWYGVLNTQLLNSVIKDQLNTGGAMRLVQLREMIVLVHSAWKERTK